jgi:hypothetical protein
VPLTSDNQEIDYWTTPATSPPTNAPSATAYSPTPDYLRTLKIPLLRGRFFTEHDRLGSEPVIVIDEILAKRAFPGQDPVGRELSVQYLGRMHIVGVIAASKHHSLDDNAYGPPKPALYIPLGQFPDEFMRLTGSGMSLMVRTSLMRHQLFKP